MRLFKKRFCCLVKKFDNTAPRGKQSSADCLSELVLWNTMPAEEVCLIHPNQGRKYKLLGKGLRQHFTKMKEYNLNILENGTRYHYPTNYFFQDFNAKTQSW